MPIVRCESLTRIYAQGAVEVRALDGVDLSVEQGEFVSVAGPSGSGKSTLLNIIGALDQPTSGRVWVSGEALQDMNKRELADLRLRRIGFVFQSYNLVPVLSALENVAFVLQLQGVDRHERQTRASRMLERVGLAGLEQRRPAELSGGQQQRVAVARALASQPDLLLADEPSANLDSRTTAALMALFQELNEQLGTTMIMVTHDPDVMRCARRRLLMRDGRLVGDEREDAAATAASADQAT